MSYIYCTYIVNFKLECFDMIRWLNFKFLISSFIINILKWPLD